MRFRLRGQVRSGALAVSGFSIAVLLTGGPAVQAAPPGGIQIAKIADATTVSAGDQIGYTVTVTNPSKIPSNALITDTLPTNPGTVWTISPAVPGCGISSGVLNCVHRLAPGSTFSVHIASPTTPGACDTVSNQASVTTANLGSATSPTATITVTCAPPSPDLIVESISFTVPSGSPPYSYTVTVKNEGTATADLTGVGVQGYYSTTAGTWPTNDGACGNTFNPGTMLAPGGSTTIPVSCSAAAPLGDTWLVVKVDDTEALAESDDTNNIGSAELFAAMLVDDGSCLFTVTASWNNAQVDHVYGIWYLDDNYLLTSEAPGIGGTISGQTAVMQAGPFAATANAHTWKVRVQFYYGGAFVAEKFTNVDTAACAVTP